MKLDDLAAYFAIAETSARRRGSGSARLSDFDGAEVFLSAAADAVDSVTGGRLYTNPDSSVFGPRLLERAGTFDVSILGNAIDSDALFSLSRWRRVTAPMVRGRVSRIWRYMCEASAAFVHDDGSWSSTDAAVFGSNDGARWMLASLNFPREGHESEKWSAKIKMAISITLQRKIDWTVDLGFGSWSRIRIPTDPSGIRALLHDRDVAAGKNRRDAVVHWVSEHLRKKRKNPDDLAYVRAHLRGQREVVWQGMRCRINPLPERVTCSLCGTGSEPLRHVRALGPGDEIVACMSCCGGSDEEACAA